MIKSLTRIWVWNLVALGQYPPGVLFIINSHGTRIEDENNRFVVTKLIIRIIEVGLVFTYIGMNTAIVTEKLDPVYLYMKHCFVLDDLAQYILGINRDHYFIYLFRLGVTSIGGLIFCTLIAVLLLALATLVILVNESMQYLINVAIMSTTRAYTRNEMPIRQAKLILRRYKHLQIYVRELNNLMHSHAGIWVATFSLCINGGSGLYCGEVYWDWELP